MKVSKVLSLFVLVLSGFVASAQTNCTSTGFSNQWASAFSCVGGGSPIVYIVQAGDSVHVSSNVGTYDTVYVYGKVTFLNGRNISMTASGVFQIMAGGNVSSTSGGNKISFGGSSVISGSFSQSGPAYANSTGGWFTGYLPVDFMGVRADRLGTDIQVQWSTASEFNNDFFSVEVSNDGTIWQEMSHVKSKARNGNSQQILNYNSTFPAAEDQKLARVKQVDQDGSMSISSVIQLPAALERDYSLTRNEHLALEWQSKEAVPMQVKMYDSMGREVASQHSDGGRVRLQAAKSGIYFFEIVANGKRYTEKLLVNP